MKISILTFHKANNYGALLQCYALSSVLKSKGHSVELLNFNLHKTSLSRSVKAKLRNYIYTKRLDKFRTEKLPLESCLYNSFEDLQRKQPKADLFIVGSDQVWNYDITKDDLGIYFFNFLEGSISRMAYAASFGLSNWNLGEREQEIAGYLGKFLAIGIREKEGLNILKSKFNIEAHNVLDPTLLLNDYSGLIKPALNKNENLVGYKFEKGGEWLDVLKYLSGETLTKPVSLNDNVLHKGILSIPIPRVEKWLSSLYNSAFIITDSFHCMVFAIIFKKQFIAMPANPKRVGRMKSLLESLNLENRFYNDYDEIYSRSDWREEIDFIAVHKKLEVLRSYSFEFLDEALKQVPNAI
ncbi:polysaccharide pyruvyl transferase family protein [Jiulongibacter sp. NS-SX5]|uniref:polysaccharide pyruvyl transferase family protein n=1 Tax=Jiulongibacter sp. NS-SX5 TaxID=3463854 RepID=UPI004058A915